MRLAKIGAVVAMVAGGLAALAVDAPVAGAAQTGGGTTFRASVSSSGQQADKPSTRARISKDGRRVVYQTKSTNLVAGDSNNLQDIFWTDLTNPFAPVTRLVSSTSTGGVGNNDAEFAEISGNGRYVVFSTLATNILSGSGASGVFIRDMEEPDPKKATRLVQGSSTRPVVSDDGRYVAYNTLPASVSDIIVKDMTTGRTLQVTTVGSDGSDAESFRPEISGDGTKVIFASDLQLLPSDTNGNGRDVYLADITAWRNGGSTYSLKLVSVGLDGLAVGGASSRPGINLTGSVVSFQSFAGNLVNGDSNGTVDAFVRDYRSNSNGQTFAVSYKNDGTIPPNAESSRPQLDDSGDVVAFVSTGGAIVNGDTNNREDSFIRNWKVERSTAQWSKNTFLLGISPNGEPGTCPGIANVDEGTKDISTRPYLSGDGRTVVFISGQCNLTPANAFGGQDTNLLADVFVRTFDDVGTQPTGPYQALAAPARLLDTRPGGATVDGQFAGIGARAAGTTLGVPVAARGGLPASPGSVVLNVTVVGAALGGYATVFPCGVAPPNASNLNFVAGETVANAVVSKVGPNGQVCIFTSAATHLLVDVGGAFPAANAYTPLAVPARLADTRPGGATVDGQLAGTGPRAQGSVLTLPVRGRAGVPTGAQSAVLNVTVVGPAAGGYITAYPCGQATPNASNVNFRPGDTVPNAVVAKIGSGGAVCLFTSAVTNLIVDIGGYFPTNAVYSALTTPARLLDTRPGGPTVDGQSSGQGVVAPFQPLPVVVRNRGGVPGNAGSVVLNVTVVGAGGVGYVSAYPCGESPPNASNLNFVGGETVANAVVSRVGVGNSVCFVSSAGIYLLADVAGSLP